jgi:FixJ family two-component response regulator
VQAHQSKYKTSQEAADLRDQYLGLIDAPSAKAYSSPMERHPRRSAMDDVLVAVVDDDESVRESLPDLIREFGFEARAFSSAREYLSSDSIGDTKCLLLDIFMPGMTGIELHGELKVRGQQIPIIFMTASKNETLRPQLIEQGAVECLCKPFSDAALLAALREALRIG